MRGVSLVIALAVGCSTAHPGSDGAGPERTGPDAARADPASCPSGRVRVDGACCVPAGRDVDLLFMLDSSYVIGEADAAFAAELPGFIAALSEGLVERRRFPPVRSLHVGVVTADMGSGGHHVPSCSEPVFGDDGVLRSAGDTTMAGCAPRHAPFLVHVPGVNDAELTAAALRCVAYFGGGGCGFEQPLESVMKALTPAESELRFFMDTTGHGTGRNAGFLREGSVLVVVSASDEDDCSLLDPDLANPQSTRYTHDLGLRCFANPSALHPVSRYVDGLTRVRRPADLIVGAIVGVPRDLDGASFDVILADPRMELRQDPALPTRVVPSCNVPGRGLAFPPRRFVALARDLGALGANTHVSSICRDDFGPAFRRIVHAIADAPPVACAGP